MNYNVSSSSSSSGIGFTGLLAIVFITLKLLGVIAWSWFWVLSPIWITAVILLAVVVVVGMLFFGRRRPSTARGVRR